MIVRQWMKEYPNQIEVIISNNDDMALGAWEALEEKGCTEVQVVGIDGIEEVRELVDEDKILGSVLCDTKLHAKALMQFIDVLAFHNGSVEKLNLENERLLYDSSYKSGKNKKKVKKKSKKISTKSNKNLWKFTEKSDKIDSLRHRKESKSKRR